jgi:4-hydroxy-3-methylbut-2-enyl diphosphate reductase
VPAVVIVGGRNSNNTRELVALARERGVPAFHVEGADELKPEWFVGLEVVGLTAGTSTLDATIDEVERALARF